MQEHSFGKVPVEDFASRGSPFQQLNQNQTGEIIRFACISGIVEGELADGRYKLSQRSVDPVIDLLIPYRSASAEISSAFLLSQGVSWNYRNTDPHTRGTLPSFLMAMNFC